MNKTEIRKLIDELCNQSGRILARNAGVQADPEWVEGFLEQSKQILLDYLENDELFI